MRKGRANSSRSLREMLLTEVRKVFEQTEVFLIGGSGFLGKIVLGMLLDRYPEVKHIHLLLRPGSNTSAEKRFTGDLLESPALTPVVQSLNAQKGSAFLQEKITVWPGDLGQRECGLDSRAFTHLAGRVGAIINCAGAVDFFPPIDESFRSNVDGVEHVVAVARRIGAKLVHISTCFVCGKRDGLVEETEPILGFYPHRRGPDDQNFNHAKEIQYVRERIRQIATSAGATSGANADARPREIAQRLIALGKQRAEHWGWVNTYTYAKSLGEQIIAAESDLGYALVRPAIVESAVRFPFPGWIEGGRTAAPLVLMALGGLKDWPVRSDIPLEVVPVDLVASAILIVTALLLESRHENVYQLGTADVNPVRLGAIVKLLDAESRKRQNGGKDRSLPMTLIDPPRRARFLGAAEARSQSVRLQEKIDSAATLIARLQAIQERAHLPGNRTLTRWSTALRTFSLQAAFRQQTLDQYLPFVLENRYIFESENIRAAYAHIPESDRKLLPWDPEKINWKDYWVNHQIKGTRKWVQPDAVKEWAFKI